MFFWTPYAFVRFVLFLIAGILLGIYFPGLFSEQFVAAALLVTGIALSFLFYRSSSSNVSGIIVFLMLILFGYLNTLYHTESRNPDHFRFNDSIVQYQVVISGYPEEKERSWKSEAEVKFINDGNSWKEVSGKVLLYFSRQDFQNPFHYGDQLLIRGAPQEITPPYNPGEFDYQRYLSYRKIYHQHFLRASSAHFISNEPQWPMLALSFRFRSWAQGVLKKYISGDQELAVASALILGIKDGLDNELVNAYSSSGAMHVLAVSGLHVGIIYMIIQFLLRPVHSRRHGKVILALVSIGLLWAYVFVTGLSPSVLRAVTMFSVIAGSRALNYSTNIFNTLAFSAFVLLLWEPYMIMSVGFQLSYLAVIGIVYLQPRLYQLWVPHSRFLDQVWQITCVSFAAQLATCSLGLLYFHQFPVYFLVSNLFVIPGALVALCLGIVLLAVSFIPLLAAGVGWVFNGILQLLNFLVISVEKLPFSLIDNIHITTFQSWLLMCILISCIGLFEYRKFAYVISLSAFALVFGLVQWYHYYSTTAQPKWVVYRVAGHNAMEWMDEVQSYFFTDSVLMNDRERIRFHVRPNRLIHGVHNIISNDSSFVFHQQGIRAFQWKSLRVLQIQEPTFSIPDNLQIDFLVISNNAVKSMDSLSKLKAQLIILDSSNSVYTCNRILQEAENRDIQVYSVLHNGAFVYRLKNT
jgi:competence protein ComEC